MFRLFPENLHIPFLSLRVPAIILSALFCVWAAGIIAQKGLRFGVDFAGGVQMVLNFSDESGVDAEMIREEFAKLGVPQVSVQNFGTEFDARPTEFIVNFPSDIVDETVLREQIRGALGGTTESPVVEDFRMSGFEKAYFRYTGELSAEALASTLKDFDLGIIHVVSVQPFGSADLQEYEINFSKLSAEIVGHFEDVYGAGALTLEKLEFVGARVGEDLKTAALLSVIVAILLVFIYIFLRFDLMYAPGVVVALGHDVLLTVGLFAFTGFEFDLTVVAALLTVAGYSINDTIIVYDRIREALGEYKGKSLLDILNIAINQTMNRTIITSGTTLLATITLWVLGGPVIHSFAFALSAGILIGTYSSIFIASPLVYWMNLWLDKRQGDAASRAKRKAVA